MPGFDHTPNLALPLLAEGQARKHITHNAAIARLDALVQLSVEGEVDAPPEGAPAGARFLLGAGSDAPGHIAVVGGEGTLAPQEGWRLWDAAAGALKVFAGGAWKALGSGSGSGSGAEPGAAPARVETLGVNADADSVNRLSVASEATLLNHEGAGHQLKVNRAGAADTASLLFQSAFAGLAEMGLTGSDDFSVKVVADGSWPTALRVDQATAEVDAPKGLRAGGVPVLVDDGLSLRQGADMGRDDTDLDAFTTTGFYFQRSSSRASAQLNCPVGAAGLLVVLSAEPFTYQIYWEFRNRGVYVRTRSGTNWFSWKVLSQQSVG